jgi:hypothetical protein
MLENPIEKEQITARLLQNQTDIGAAMATIYGPAIGKSVESLLKQHILLAANVITEAKNNSPELDSAVKIWFNNADDISKALYSINPYFGSLNDIQRMMYDHLNLTISEIKARLKKDGSDILAFEAVYNMILHMADMLTSGIVKQHNIYFMMW